MSSAQSEEVHSRLYWLKMVINMAQTATVLCLTNFPSTLHGESLILYSYIWTILILHLLIIWVTTWVFVLSDTPSGLLWVEVAKTTLFRGFLHINAARVLVVEHLMRRQQLFLELLYRHAPVCLSVVLIFFFGRLWKIVFAGKSLFFCLSLSWPRTELSSARFSWLSWSPLPFYMWLGPIQKMNVYH